MKKARSGAFSHAGAARLRAQQRNGAQIFSFLAHARYASGFLMLSPARFVKQPSLHHFLR